MDHVEIYLPSTSLDEPVSNKLLTNMFILPRKCDSSLIQLIKTEWCINASVK